MSSEFLNFWIQLYTKPKGFFIEHIANSTKEPKYFPLAFVFFGIGYGIDRLDAQLIKYEMRGQLDEYSFINSWIGYWLIAVIGGLIGGYIMYLIGGWFFNVRLKWSKGKGEIDKSRYMYLYSSVILYFIILLLTVITTFVNPIPYDPYSDFSLWDLITMAVILFGAYYSIYVGYSGVISITDADLFRAKVWFLVIPIMFNTVAYITLITLIVNYFI